MEKIRKILPTIFFLAVCPAITSQVSAQTITVRCNNDSFVLYVEPMSESTGKAIASRIWNSVRGVEQANFVGSGPYIHQNKRAYINVKIYIRSLSNAHSILNSAIEVVKSFNSSYNVEWQNDCSILKPPPPPADHWYKVTNGRSRWVRMYTLDVQIENFGSQDDPAVIKKLRKVEGVYTVSYNEKSITIRIPERQVEQWREIEDRVLKTIFEQYKGTWERREGK